METPGRPRGSGEPEGLRIREEDRDVPRRSARSQRRRLAQIALEEWKGRFYWLLRAAMVVLLVLFLDGLRREGGELKAYLDSFTGNVGVLLAGKTRPQPARRNMGLVTRDVVSTAASSDATLSFPDGSAIYVEPATRFEVRLMDYARDGVRDRSLLVRSGAVVARVGRFFGLASQTRICTPTAVAAARGTGFRLSYDPRSRQSQLAVVDGTVIFRTAGGVVTVRAGQSALAVGSGPPSVSVPPNPVLQASTTAFQGLGRFDAAPHPVVAFESRLCALADPLLRRVGFAPGGWDPGGTDSGRRQQCVAAIRLIQQQIAGSASGDAPASLNPITLEELRLDDRERDQVQNAFAGGMIESYRKTGINDFILRVRARDRARTLYEGTESAVRVAAPPRAGAR